MQEIKNLETDISVLYNGCPLVRNMDEKTVRQLGALVLAEYLELKLSKKENEKQVD